MVPLIVLAIAFNAQGTKNEKGERERNMFLRGRSVGRDEHNNPPVIRAPLSARSFSARTRYLESFAILVPDPPRFIRSAMKGFEASMRARIRLFSVSRDRVCPRELIPHGREPARPERRSIVRDVRQRTHWLTAFSLSLSLSFFYNTSG